MSKWYSRLILTDGKQEVINPAADETVVLLRRLVKLMESQAVVDGGNRQRVSVDAFGGSASGLPPLFGSGTAANTPRVTIATDSATVLGVQTAANIASQQAAGTAIGNVYIDKQMLVDTARNAFANGIRSKLTFS